MPQSGPADFLDGLSDMDDANRAILQRGQEQHDQFMHLLLESQAKERDMRHSWSRKQKKAGGSRRTFRMGFCLFLDSLLSHLEIATMPHHLTEDCLNFSHKVFAYLYLILSAF